MVLAPLPCCIHAGVKAQCMHLLEQRSNEVWLQQGFSSRAGDATTGLEVWQDLLDLLNDGLAGNLHREYIYIHVSM